MTLGANPHVVDLLRERFTAAADPQRAVAMRAYMRDQFPFLGIPSPQLKVLLRGVSPTDLKATVLALWNLPEREYQYAACALLRRGVKSCDESFIGTARHLIVTKSWWDTVDTLAAHTVGPLVARHPSLVNVMDEWIRDDNMWIARTALLHQLGYKESTDPERLFRYCLERADHPDFFIRKAIGWALRQYAWVQPEAVRAFVKANEGTLSPLSKKEALKNVG
ncbi:DNA alkylation repair protein [Allorhizocola rhizosphaerae]|uniref:DNA alkylation repair protein n=1 Tax=Allorhizocola rhizosphaerae TaxID=1872709 RepID=UPI000E3BBF49|nr:DNA alkylation repair protein [Allorhizocola rhizosphaerae]